MAKKITTKAKAKAKETIYIVLKEINPEILKISYALTDKFKNDYNFIVDYNDYDYSIKQEIYNREKKTFIILEYNPIIKVYNSKNKSLDNITFHYFNNK